MSNPIIQRVMQHNTPHQSQTHIHTVLNTAYQDDKSFPHPHNKVFDFSIFRVIHFHFTLLLTSSSSRGSSVPVTTARICVLM